jgi:predicted ATPase/DNA-binding winged helix-turn-helix (wHTH) protein
MAKRPSVPLELAAEDPELPLAPEYRFGEFVLRPQERQLLRFGEALQVTARAFDVLVLLVRRSGRLVSKDDLMQRVWAGVIVEENNIAVHVAQLRKLLGARAIANIPGMGYRFALELKRERGDQDVPATSPEREFALGNMPARVAPLIGRDRELADLVARVADHPLVTLCGAAGIGKTHLAMSAARQLGTRFPDGVFWVELASLADGSALVPLLLRVLGVRTDASEEPVTALRRRLKPRQLLLVLDNAEHLVHEVGQLADDLLQAAPQLTLLVTSQVPLRSSFQQVFRLGPMELPAEGTTVDEAQRSGAMRLFAQRAAGSGTVLAWDDAGTATAAGICRALDGNALAIELAAARLPSLGLSGLASRLHQRLGLFTPASQVPPSRRNTLALAFDWSHGLLSKTEQRVFRRLSVFPGSFDLDWAAECIADADLPPAKIVESILDLVDRSLVHPDHAQRMRYRLLETGRFYARDRLEAAGESKVVHAGFTRGMQRLMAQAFAEHWQGAAEAWKARWTPEVDNLNRAFELSLQDDLPTAVALYGSGWPVWLANLEHSDARARGELLTTRLPPGLPAAVEAPFWEGVARANSIDYPQRSRDAAQRAAQLYTELADPRGQYLAWAEYTLNWRVDHPEARRAMSLAKAVEDPGWPAVVLSRGRNAESMLALSSGQVGDARAALQSALALCERDGDTEGALRAAGNLADVERAAGNIDEAVARGEAMLPLFHSHDTSPLQFTFLGNLIGALVAQGNLQRARELVEECAIRHRLTPADTDMWGALDALALLHARGGAWHRAGQLAGAADRAHRERGQDARQPNEAEDRRQLDLLLAQRFDDVTLSVWKTEGQRMADADVWRMALDVSTLAFEG